MKTPRGQLCEFDRAHIWHPYSSMQAANTVFAVSQAKGVYLQLENGKKLIDGMSSWWAAIHGYNHPQINQALKQQIDQMSHVMFGGLTHEPAVTLARKLVELTHVQLDYIFFSDSGSVSVEVAMKMAIQYQTARGYTQKQRFLSFYHGYHGDTFAAMSVCDPVNGMHHYFSHSLQQQYFAPAPSCNEENFRDDMLDEVIKLLQQHAEQIAAVIIEPLVQGAGGMRIYCPQYLNRLREVCDQFDVLLIYDEIATGFGRTGSLFAYEQSQTVPDILCLGKALTGGYMTLAATMTTEKVVQGIHDKGYDSSNEGILMHGPTFMANPLACTAANSSIDLLLASDWQKKISQIEAQLIRELSLCRQLEIVADVRVKGAIGIVELKQKVDMNWIVPRFVQAGVWIRPFNKLVYLMPPYIIQADELSILTTSVLIVLKEMEMKTGY